MRLVGIRSYRVKGNNIDSLEITAEIDLLLSVVICGEYLRVDRPATLVFHDRL